MSKNINILSINIRGEAEELVSDHQSAKTAYNKIPISTSEIYLTATGFQGDIVVDKKHHGGNDKAICCYNADRFPYWKSELGFDLQFAAFGENLTLQGEAANEENVYIGDRYQFGEAIVEVSEPRGPCYMIGIKYNYKQFPLLCQKTGYTGFYLRTIKEGIVKRDDQLIHLFSHPEKISVMQVNQIRYQDPKNKTELERLVNLQELTEEWRDRFAVLLRKAT
ncbi:MAG: MOSC domain-containing protein [Bacteroidetes bacterium]|nr:MOSC domain-containing protein [Bacteroidota bacterium]MBU1372362.1 MOSC domain-containing protein [Bacteroidota bacterium]MBU1483386.1 MOSC domain-containing protein [Bacteroidota bacterium]MBU1760584.1 MOSC domain-containing protein [Bacteroidota bacterium]MBU2046230.1 MOSC domain-containing protein [Bacteroidota bacterium]